VKRTEDIPHIVLGSIRDYFNPSHVKTLDSFLSIPEWCEVKAGELVTKSIMVIEGLPFTQKCSEDTVFDLNDKIFRHRTQKKLF